MTPPIQTAHVVICDEWAEVWCRGVRIAQVEDTRIAVRIAQDTLATTTLYQHHESPTEGRS